MDEHDDFQPRREIAKDVSQQRYGLFQRASSGEGKHERLEAELKVRVKPLTMARLKLYAQDYSSGYPSLDELVDEALHEYLLRMGW
jgi:hypothetical protein